MATAYGMGAEYPGRKAADASAGSAGTGPGGDAAADAGPRIYSVTQYNKAVERKMKAIPRTWVKGVITQLNVRGRIAYVSIAEFGEGDARPLAVLDTTLWTSQLEVFNLRFASLPQPMTLRVELKVAFLLESNFYVPSGRFQPRIVDVDETFTMGELAVTRQKILERLVKDGLLQKNKALPMPEPALRIGLVTAPGSAAYKDFTTVLLQSGFSFQVTVAPARMQGDATESTVLHALELLSVLPLDVICIVRGGGSKTDLVYFDSEAICRAIAACPVPVLTGIGHEIDNSLADLVAWADKITPTDCAKFLEGMAAECYGRLDEIAGRVREAWRMEYQQCWHDLAQQAGALRREWEGRRVTEDLRCREQARLLRSSALRTLKEEAREIRDDAVGLTRGPRKLLRMERLRFRNRSQAIASGWARWRDKGALGLAEAGKRLRDRSRRALAAGAERQARVAGLLGERARAGLDKASAALAPLRRLLTTGWSQASRSGAQQLALKEKLVHAADPARVLELGFAILRDARGAAVRSVAGLKEGDVVRGELADGTVETKVIGTKEKA